MNPEPHSEAARPWELFPHGADVGVRGRGESEAEAFENTARALTAVLVDPAEVRPEKTVRISCEAPDIETLLVDWLNALVYEMATRSMVFGEFRVSLSEGRLEGEARGEILDGLRHAPAVEIKGATYTALKVARDSDGLWTAECVLDV